MSGLDEQVSTLRKCMCCGEEQNTWCLINEDGGALGFFNQDASTIDRFGVLNSGYYLLVGAEAFWKALKGVKCSECYINIFEQRFMRGVVDVLKGCLY